MITLERFLEYQKDAARTCPDLGSDEKNKLHMIAGMVTEAGELVDPYKKELAYGKKVDFTNVEEEWADGMWYIANYHRMFPEEIIEPLVTGDIEKAIQDYKGDDLINVLVLPKIISLFVLGNISIKQILGQWILVGKLLGIDMEKALTNNIDKLKVRYPQKFDSEKAINRNLEAERKELEK